MNLRQILRLMSLDLSIDKVELSAAPPFVKIIFDRAGLLGLRQSQEVIRDMLTRYFIRRRVMWEDFSKESSGAVIASLQEAERDLDEFARTLNRSRRPSATALSQVTSSWATACSATWKNLQHSAHQPGAGKDDQWRARRDALLSLRERVYPLVRALIDFLPDDDPLAVEATAQWEAGLNVLARAAGVGGSRATRAQRGAAPEWDVVPPAER